MNFAFCPNCGKQNTVQKQDDTNYVCTSCNWQFWNNPKAAVAVVFLKGQEVLVSQRAIEPYKGKFDFPGGFLDYNENPVHAAIREIQEEAGVTIKETILVDVAGAHEYMPGISAMDVIYAVTVWEGEPVAHDDSAALLWKPIDFIDTSEFAWSYPGLSARLKTFAE